MEKVCCEAKCVETDEGFKVEVKGEHAKEMLKAWKRGDISCCGFTKKAE